MRSEGLQTMWNAGLRASGRLILIVALLAGMGSGIFHVGQALAGSGMLAVGIA